MTGERSFMLRRVVLQVTLRGVGLRLVGLQLIGRRDKEATMEIEQAVAAGSAVGQVSFNALIAALMIDALTLVTLGRIRSHTGSSMPVVFNLSTAQVLRLFSHWTHISLI